MNKPLIFVIIFVGIFWGALFLTLKRVQFILAAASFLILIGLLFLGLQQMDIVCMPSDVASSIVRGLEDRQFSRDEVQKMLFSFTEQIRQHSPNIFYSAIPISIGCFLVGRFSKNGKRSRISHLQTMPRRFPFQLLKSPDRHVRPGTLGKNMADEAFISVWEVPSGKWTVKKPFVGSWRITELPGFDAEYVDLCGPAKIKVSTRGTGTMNFGTVEVDLDCKMDDLDERVLRFSFEDGDDGDPTCGRGFRPQAATKSM